MRGAVHHVAVVEATADTREHHRHCCAPAGRHARVRRTPRARADRGERAARAHIERRRPPGRAAAPDCRRGGDAARGREARALAASTGFGRARGRDARRSAARGARQARPALRRPSAGKRSRATSRADPLWLELRDVPLANGLRACCSTPIVTSGDRIHGTLDLYFDSARGPKTEELDLATRLTQLLGIAIRRKLDESRAARQRSAFPRAVRQRRGRGLPGRAVWRDRVGEPSDGPDARLRRREDLGRQNVADLFVEPKERERLVSELKTYGRVRNFEYRLRRRDGREIVAVENSRVVSDAHGRELYYEGTVTDITQRKAAERALFNEKERAQVTLHSIGDARHHAPTPSGNIDYLNPVAERLTGWERRDAAGRPIADVFQARRRDHRQAAGRTRSCAASPRAGSSSSRTRAAHEPRRRRDRDPRLGGADPATAAASSSAPSWCSRTSPRAAAAARDGYLASHDALTGLINRREFEERLQRALRSAAQTRPARRAPSSTSTSTSSRWSTTPAATSPATRCCEQITDAAARARARRPTCWRGSAATSSACCSRTARSTDAGEIAREPARSRSAEFRFALAGQRVFEVGVSASASCRSTPTAASVGPRHERRRRRLLRRQGQRPQPHPRVRAGRRVAERHGEMQWVARIHRALEEQRFGLFYQPIVPIRCRQSSACAALRALLRMRDERGQIVPPSAFIPAAERYNLMPIDRPLGDQRPLDTLAYRGGPSTAIPTRCRDQPLRARRWATSASSTSCSTSSTATGDRRRARCASRSPRRPPSATSRKAIALHRALQGARLPLRRSTTSAAASRPSRTSRTCRSTYLKIDGQFVRNVTRDAGRRSRRGSDRTNGARVQHPGDCRAGREPRGHETARRAWRVGSRRGSSSPFRSRSASCRFARAGAESAPERSPRRSEASASGCYDDAPATREIVPKS